VKWTDEAILRLWVELFGELGLRADSTSGAVLWTVFSNNERVLDSDGMVVDCGSFRGCAGMVAFFCGGNYMDYYMSNYRVDEIEVDFMRVALLRRGFTLTDWDSWKAGVLDGRYPCPERDREYFERVRRGETK
jgi:hypothetical protein